MNRKVQMSLLYLQNNSAIQNLFKKLLWNRTCIEQVEDESLKIILPIQNLKGLLTLKSLFLKMMSSNFQAIFTSKEVSKSIENFLLIVTRIPSTMNERLCFEIWLIQTLSQFRHQISCQSIENFHLIVASISKERLC